MMILQFILPRIFVVRVFFVVRYYVDETLFQSYFFFLESLSRGDSCRCDGYERRRREASDLSYV